MAIIDAGSVRLQSLNHKWFHSRQGTHVSILRLDEIHPDISGNKWFKLTENLTAAKRNGYAALLSFGGPYSNHLHALAMLAAAEGFASIGIVRGLQAIATTTMQACAAAGMQLHYVSREAYTQKNNPEWLQALEGRLGKAFIIPEGGNNDAGRKGAEGIAAFLPAGTTHVCCPAGTGTTVAGLRAALPAAVQVLAFTPFKNGSYLEREIRQHLPEAKNINWQIIPQYHFGGFGKITESLRAFMHAAFSQLSLPLDRVYTAKMMFGLQELLAQGFFPEGSQVVAVHTGGLQGNQPGDLPT